MRWAATVVTVAALLLDGTCEAPSAPQGGGPAPLQTPRRKRPRMLLKVTWIYVKDSPVGVSWIVDHKSDHMGPMSGDPGKLNVWLRPVVEGWTKGASVVATRRHPGPLTCVILTWNANDGDWVIRDGPHGGDGRVAAACDYWPIGDVGGGA